MSNKLVVAALLALSACSTERIYGKNRELLASAHQSVASNQLERAEYQATQVLVDTGNVADDYALQRFFAAYLMTLANMRAFFQDPWLTEPDTGAWANLGGGGGRRPSRTGHLVATAYNASYALGLFPSARAAKAVEKGEKLLPAELEELGVEDANLFAKLSMLTVYSRLQYQDQVNQILRATEGSTDLAKLDAMLDRARVSKSMRPWIYLAVFENLRKANEKAAYKLAIRTLDAARDQDAASFDEELLRGVEGWIVADSSYVFRCPECPDSTVSVTYPLCPKCRNVERIEFVPEVRATWTGSKALGEGP